jgi:hypothetical protein
MNILPVLQHLQSPLSPTSIKCGLLLVRFARLALSISLAHGVILCPHPCPRRLLFVTHELVGESAATPASASRHLWPAVAFPGTCIVQRLQLVLVAGFGLLAFSSRRRGARYVLLSVCFIEAGRGFGKIGCRAVPHYRPKFHLATKWLQCRHPCSRQTTGCLIARLRGRHQD